MTKEEQAKLLREVTHKNKTSALVALNTSSVQENEVLNFKYYTESGRVDSLVAVGLRDGVGPDTYTMVSDQTIPIITSVLDYRPDVSETISGAVYLYDDPRSNQYLRYYHLSGSVVEEEITESFYFTNLEDGCFYYFDATKGAQRIINISLNLSDKASFQGIINVTEERYAELEENGEIIDDILYFINNGVMVIGMYYNYMPIEFGSDPSQAISKRLKELEEKVGESDGKLVEIENRLGTVEGKIEVLNGNETTEGSVRQIVREIVGSSNGISWAEFFDD